MKNENLERARADLTLLTVSFVWGSAFVAQRVAAARLDAFTFNGLRFLLGALVLLPLALSEKPLRNPTQDGKLLRSPWLGPVLAGMVLFIASAFQQWGLRYTTAGNAGFITGLYVVFIPLLLSIFWKQHLRRAIWLAAVLSAAGLFLLSSGGRLQLAVGDLFELAGAVFWALHVIVIGLLARAIPVGKLSAGQYAVCGFSSLLVGIIRSQGFPLSELQSAVLPVAYTGIFSIGLGYTLQAVGQRVAPPADAAILLSLEAVFAAFFGWILLGEALAPVQLAGCGLMLSGMFLAQGLVKIPKRREQNQWEAK